MDHVDWLDQEDIDVLCSALKDQVLVSHKLSMSVPFRDRERERGGMFVLISLILHCRDHSRVVV